MAISKVDIANMALTHLAMKGITSLTENTPSAIACNNFFVPCRDDVFRESRWPFASANIRLVIVPDEVLGWEDIYLYPPDAATVWNVYNESTVLRKDSQEFEVFFVPSSNRRVIATNLPEAYASCTYKVEDTSVYDPKFVMALSYRLAASMAHTLTGSPEIGVQLMNIYVAIIHEAKRVSGSEKFKKPTFDSSYQNSRG
jgi:hypothetical protein